MDISVLMDIVHTAERLKDATRHCKTSKGRPESVAEHCWRAALMADLLRDSFPDADMDKVVRMCLWHDLGEAFTGDIPVFEKTDADEKTESGQLKKYISSLPSPLSDDLSEMFSEMDALQTTEAKIYKAIDALEALIQHNESDISTWLPLEYDLQMTYGVDKTRFSPFMQDLRTYVREESVRKIEDSRKDYDE